MRACMNACVLHGCMRAAWVHALSWMYWQLNYCLSSLEHSNALVLDDEMPCPWCPHPPLFYGLISESCLMLKPRKYIRGAPLLSSAMGGGYYSYRQWPVVQADDLISTCFVAKLKSACALMVQIDGASWRCEFDGASWRCELTVHRTRWWRLQYRLLGMEH